MACSSITSLPRACSTGIMAGLAEVYMIAYNDLQSITPGTSAVYSTASNGVVNNVGLVTNKNFVLIGTLKSTAGLKETLNKDVQKGIYFFNQNLSIFLSDLTLENIAFIQSVLYQPVSVLLKSRTKKYFIIGLNGLFELTAIDGGTGTAEGDTIGYNLIFQGISRKLAALVDDSIIPILLGFENSLSNSYVVNDYVDSYFE